jgi:YidC/Oxa1 family membrane protein insertase
VQDYFSFILYPVSAILWFWHKVFGFVLSPDNGFAWALSIFFLVFTLRLLLIKPALSQLRSGRKMQQFQPQLQKLREKYKNDRQKMAEEMRKLQTEHGVNPVGGCAPALLQIPVFLSLVTVLRDFTYPEARTQGVFIFNPQEVGSFINAHIFGAKLGNWITQPTQALAALGTDRASMLLVGIPLMITASVATFFTMRLSVNKQGSAAMANPQSAMISKAMMYLAPLGLLVSGAFWPLGLLLYFLANNVWTLGQQHFLTSKIDREEEQRKAEEKAKKEAAPRPKPGQKPPQKQKQSEQGSGEAAQSSAQSSAQPSEGTELNGQPLDEGKAAAGTSNGQGASSSGAPKAGGKPNPGAKQTPGKKAQQPKRGGGKQQAGARKGQKKKR